MIKLLQKLGISGAVIGLVMGVGAVAFALPSQASGHAPANAGAAGNNSAAAANSHAATGQANAQVHLAAAKLKACQNRQNAINNIISRINERAQNQLTLFSTIASRVESFYTKQGKTLSNYNQLVSNVNNAKAQAETDFSTMKTNSTFTCTMNDPKGMVTAFQSYLKTEISDLQNYRTAVKNLIVGVASANGVTVSTSSSTTGTTSQGGQQ